MPLSVDSVLEQNRSLPATLVDGQIVVLSLDAGAYFDFDQSATEIWLSFTTPRKVDEILNDLARQYDLSAETIAKDVLPFLEQMVHEKLLRVSGT